MATPVKTIEKEYLLRVLYDEDIPIIFYRDGAEYAFFLSKPIRDEIVLQSRQPVDIIKVKDRLELTFEFRSKKVAFDVEVLQIKDQEITCNMPNFFYKDLDRAYSRVNLPPQMQISFSFLGDRYNLSFPKVMEYDVEDFGELLQDKDPKNLSGLIEQMAAWIKHYSNNHRLVLFKDNKPSITEERVIAETGKALFLPSTRGSLPLDDPFPRRRIITENIFKRYLESTGIGLGFVSSACARFLKAKADNGILSDVWIPILFHEYVIGYIHAWNEDKGKPPFDYTMMDTLYQFTKVLAHSLEVNGYFAKGKIKNSSFEGKVVDISASGLLFAYPYTDLSSALAPDSKLVISMTAPQRAITVNAVIVRRFKDKSLGYYGCQFENLGDDDFRYLYHFIYGKPYTP